MVGRRGWLVAVASLAVLLGCQRDSDANLRDAYDRMLATAERRPARVADTVASPAAETPEPETLPIEAPPAQAPAETAAVPRDTAPPAFEGTAGVEERRRAGPAATLRDVRSAQHQGFDRIVFEFEGEMPGYNVAFVNPPIRECGSGNAVEVAGTAWLQVRLSPARAHAFEGEAARVTVSNRSRQLSHEVVRQLTLTCDFEAQVEWVLGLASRSGYRALELSEPARLVIDVLH